MPSVQDWENSFVPSKPASTLEPQERLETMLASVKCKNEKHNLSEGNPDHSIYLTSYIAVLD